MESSNSSITIKSRKIEKSLSTLERKKEHTGGGQGEGQGEEIRGGGENEYYHYQFEARL